MHRLLQLFYLMAPAYLANMAPPFLRYWKGWNRPISRRWLGDHKTTGGVLLGILVALVTAWAQSLIDWSGSLVSYDRWPLIGLALGAGALSGDLIKSFFKRARGIAPGQRWIPADQLDFVLGALLFAAPLAHLAWRDVIVVIAVSFAGDIAVNRVAYRWKIRDTPW